MPKLIDVPNYGTVEFPDTMNDAQITAAIQNNLMRDKLASDKSSGDSIIDKAKSYGNSLGVGLKTGISRGLQGYVQPLMEGENGFVRNALGIGSSLSPLANGLATIPNEFINTKDIDNKIAQASREFAQNRENEYAKSYQENPLTTGSAMLAGNIATGLPLLKIPGVFSKNIGTSMLANAAGGAISGLGQYVPGNDSTERAKNVGFSGVLGALVAPVARGVDISSDAINSLFKKGVKNTFEDVMTKMVAPRVFAGVNPEIAIPVKQAGDSVGVHLSPAEASGSKLAYGVQGRSGITPQAAMEKQNYENARVQQERASIQNLKNDISPPKDSQNYVSPTPLYDKVKSTILPKEQFDGLLQDDLVKRSYDNVLKNPEFSNLRKDLNQNSMKYLDLTKQDMDTYISQANREKNKTGATELLKSKNNLVSQLDALSSDYAPARQAAKQEIIGRNLDKRLDKPDIGASDFYKNELSRNSKFNQLVSDTKDTPGVTQKLNAMRVSFKDLINPRTGGGTATLAKSSLDVPRSSAEWYSKALAKLTGGQLDKATVRLIANPNWDKELLKLRQIRDVNKRNLAFVNILSKAEAEEITSPD